MVHHISGEQNPSSLWDIFGQRKAIFGEQMGSEWPEPTAAPYGQLATTLRGTNCIIHWAGSNYHHCMCSSGLRVPPIQSNSPPMAAHLQYQISIITQFLVTFGKSSLKVLQSHFLTFPPNSAAEGHSPVHPVGTTDCKLTRGVCSLEWRWSRYKR